MSSVFFYKFQDGLFQFVVGYFGHRLSAAAKCGVHVIAAFFHIEQACNNRTFCTILFNIGNGSNPVCGIIAAINATQPDATAIVHGHLSILPWLNTGHDFFMLCYVIGVDGFSHVFTRMGIALC